MNPPSTVLTERTNFDGDWSEVCLHCAQPQAVHRIIHGPFDGVLYEHRMPCEAEKKKMHHQTRRVVQTGKLIVLVGWILVPLLYLLLQQFVAVIGWIAFGIGIVQLLIFTFKCFGNPDRWIPGHAKKKEEEARHAHFIYHCERNPEGFARLRHENFERTEKDPYSEGSVSP